MKLLRFIAATILFSTAASVCVAQHAPRVEIIGPPGDNSQSVLRIQRAVSGASFPVVCRIFKPSAPSLIPVVPGDGDKYKYVLQSVTLIVDGSTARSDIASTDFVTSSHDETLQIEKEFANNVIRLQATSTFVAVKIDGTVIDDTAAARNYSTKPVAATEVSFINDIQVPRLLKGSIVVDRFPGGGGFVTAALAENDLNTSTLNASGAFTFTRTVTPGTTPVTESFIPVGTPTFDPNSRSLTFEFKHLNPGDYTLVVAAGKVKDLVGNSMADASHAFTVPGAREHGTQVEYPRNLTPGNQDNLLVNPGDRIDTRDVRLYYFRDAHRVAEIINRNVRSLNQVGYDAAQRFAQQARETAESHVDERRRVETLSVQAAQTTRATRAALDKARQESRQAQDNLNRVTDRRALIDQETRKLRVSHGFPLVAADSADVLKDFDEKIAQVEVQITEKRNELDSLPVASKPAAQRELDGLNDQLQKLNTDRRAVQTYELVRAQEQRQEKRLQVQVQNTQADVTRLQSKVITDEQAEIDLRNDVQSAEVKELRSEQERFRREVAAGLTDRDTYVAGKLSSVDPVTQVTITVVGEGTLQLRGPVNGINKICRMVHQIDSPVGQVKIGIHTIQINGEHGDRMERVYEDIEKYVAYSRFLTAQSGLIFRKAVSQVASQIAHSVDGGYVPPGCEQLFMVECIGQNSRDMKYMYAFFGRDFVDELREMDSELLNSDNKLLSLHSMDTISLAGALHIAALANNTVRQQIIQVFQSLILTELTDKEIQYYRTLTRTPHRNNFLNKLMTQNMQLRRDEKDAERILFNAHRTYNFANTVGFFDSQLAGEGTLNNVQYAVIRLAQTLKAQLIAEQELKNLVKQLSLLEVRDDEIEEDYTSKTRQAAVKLQEKNEKLDSAVSKGTEWLKYIDAGAEAAHRMVLSRPATERHQYVPAARFLTTLSDRLQQRIRDGLLTATDLEPILQATLQIEDGRKLQFIEQLMITITGVVGMQETYEKLLESKDFAYVLWSSKDHPALEAITDDPVGFRRKLIVWKNEDIEYRQAETEYQQLKDKADDAEELLFSKRMLQQFIDEQEEKSVELLEALRSHSSNVDNYLKRLAIAVEDDVNAQFYEPAFQKIRRVSRTYDVQLGQIETTTVLTNNRTLAKVSPAATMEFDLPKREIVLTEAMKGAQALTQEYGNLLQDGTFLAGTSMLAGQPAAGLIGSASPVQQIPGISTGEQRQFGAALEGLIPDPAVYKFETGTGFEIRPVIQPDGHSIVYNFDYMYTTNVREPVRADEKHLGRVKRHFVHTDVQTSSYELREVSRYTVALKASRTSRGVPGLEDVPIAGVLFRPAASDESSLQENIILASSVIYPTLYDLMGLRWSPYVDDVSSSRLASEKILQRQRYDEVRQKLLARTHAVVNERLGITNQRPVIPETITPGYEPRPVYPEQISPGPTPEITIPGTPVEPIQPGDSTFDQSRRNGTDQLRQGNVQRLRSADNSGRVRFN